ncbi:MAG: hypothetical protein AAGA99_18075 [Actinomycetota bacterium]
MRMRHLVMVLALVFAGCGASDSDDDAGSEPAATVAATEAASETTSPLTNATPDTAAAPTTTAPTTTTAAPTTTEAPPAPAGAALEDLVELIGVWATADTDASLAPLDLAERIIGFPLAIPVPEGATANDLELRARPLEDELWEWTWRYGAVAGPDPGDVDINAEDKGPGAVFLRETYDPIMGGLGFEYSNSTTSDPGDPGGPNSTNNVYVADSGTITVAGVERSVDPVFVWLDDDLIGFEDGVETPGFIVDVPVELPEGEIPLLFLSELIEGTPLPDGAELASATFRSQSRQADSFDADLGLRYLTVEIDWAVGIEAGAALAATVLDSFDDPRLRATTPSFFEEGSFEPSRLSETSDGWRHDLLLLDRYPGTFIFRADEDDGTAELTLRLVIEPLRQLLTPPAG